MWVDMDIVCTFIYASFLLCLNGAIYKFLNNSFLCLDLLQPISLPSLIPAHRPHTVMQYFTLPAYLDLHSPREESGGHGDGETAALKI